MLVLDQNDIGSKWDISSLKLTVATGIITPNTTNIQSLIVDSCWGYLIDSSLQKNPRSWGLSKYLTVNAGIRTKWKHKKNLN
jgi:hypothetical protein